MSYCIEICARKHFISQFIINQKRKTNPFIVKRIKEPSYPFRQGASPHDLISTSLNNSTIEDFVSFCIPQKTVSRYLSHFHSYNLPEFSLAIKYMLSYCNSFSRILC